MIIAENDMTMIVIKKVFYAFFVLILWIIFAFCLSYLLGDASFCRMFMRAEQLVRSENLKTVLVEPKYDSRDGEHMYRWFKDEVMIQERVYDIKKILEQPEFLGWIKSKAMEGDPVCAVILIEGYLKGMFDLQQDKSMSKKVATLLGYDNSQEQWYPSLMANEIDSALLMKSRWDELQIAHQYELLWTRWELSIMGLLAAIGEFDELLMMVVLFIYGFIVLYISYALLFRKK